VAWLITVALLIVGFLGRGLVGGGLTTPPLGGNAALAKNPNADRTPGVFTVLLLGIDNRAKQLTMQRTDTIMVLHVNVKTGHMYLMSVPRDTRMILKGYGVQKINAAAEFEGGPTGTVQAVNNLLGTNIQYYVLTNFSGFKDVIDALGGIQIDVPEAMNYQASNVHIHLKPGLQWMNGTEALQFVRFREFQLGDIGRTMDQQMLLKALAKRILSPGGLIRLPLAVPQLSKAVVTNLPARDLLYFVRIARRLDTQNPKVLSETLPGDYLTAGGISYWYVVPADAVQGYRNLIRGHVMPGAPFDPKAVAAVTSGEWATQPLVSSGPVEASKRP
jgi:LCP family protein required for cell wall assembly